MRSSHYVYRDQMPLGGPLEPWLILARRLEESVSIELGERIAHSTVQDDIGSLQMFMRIEGAASGSEVAQWFRS